MDEYEDWVGALSGKIKSISTDGVVELEGAGLQVFEKKKAENKPLSLHCLTSCPILHICRLYPIYTKTLSRRISRRG